MLHAADSYTLLEKGFPKIKLPNGSTHWFEAIHPHFTSHPLSPDTPPITVQIHEEITDQESAQKAYEEANNVTLARFLLRLYMQTDGFIDGSGNHHIYDLPSNYFERDGQITPELLHDEQPLFRVTGGGVTGINLAARFELPSPRVTSLIHAIHRNHKEIKAETFDSYS